MMASFSSIRDEEVELLPESEIKQKKGINYLRLIFAVIMAISLAILAVCAIEKCCWSSSDSTYSLQVLILGDWGRDGLYNQSEVATQMGIVGDRLDIDFVISTGDNFYETGLTGANDTKFTTSFTNVYTASSLQTTWYSVLGNHDYMGDALAQLDAVMVSRDPRWFCHREFQLKRRLCAPAIPGTCDSTVEFFFIDTTPFIDEYWTPSNMTFDWRGLAPRAEQLKSQIQSLEKLLSRSTATWKVVVGHHTIYSFGHHGDSPELIRQVLPVLEAYNVDLYLNGHDHCLEHVKRPDSNVHLVTSGGGSRAWQGIRKSDGHDNGLLFGYDGQGFISLSISSSALHVRFYDVFGNVIHNLNLSRDL